MPATSISIEAEYQARIDAMSPAERVARSAAMFAWTRQQIARQIIDQMGDMSHERLKWLVALRLYGDQPIVRAMIANKLTDVSR